MLKLWLYPAKIKDRKYLLSGSGSDGDVGEVAILEGREEGEWEIGFLDIIRPLLDSLAVDNAPTFICQVQAALPAAFDLNPVIITFTINQVSPILFDGPLEVNVMENFLFWHVRYIS